jgi:ADP-heptose:LPS heptosyltransferase/SAM-dependent methyltransferase
MVSRSADLLANSPENSYLHTLGILRSAALTRENEQLRNVVRHYASDRLSPARKLMASLRHEAFGDFHGRIRFLKRVVRQIVYRSVGARVFQSLGPVPSLAENDPDIDALLRPLLFRDNQVDLSEGGEGNARITDEAQKTWNGFVAGRRLPYLRSLKPHGGGASNLRILMVVGGGGVGDILLSTPLIRELKRKLSPCEITVFNPQRIAHEIFDGNPNVTCTMTGDWSEALEASRAVQHLDIFDLIVYNVCFVPQIVRCRRSRLPWEDHRQWIRGNNETFSIFSHLLSNAGISLLDRIVNIHYLDLLGIASGLPISAQSPLYFTPDPKAVNAVALLDLPHPYVTVRDGANEGDTTFARDHGASRTTKQLPAGKWQEIAAELRKSGLHIVQVGGSRDSAIPSIDRDLRGRTTLSELCFIMKGAITHIDTEGGLAHFARAVNRRSIVMFGPTSATFFGFAQNINVRSEACSPCWYINDTWIARCPRGAEAPSCTATISAASIAELARRELVSQRARSFRIVGAGRYDRRWRAVRKPLASAQDWRKTFTVESLHRLERGISALRVAVLDPPGCRLGVELASEGYTAHCVTLPLHPDRRELQPNPIRMQAPPDSACSDVVASPFNLPLETASFDAVVGVDLLSATAYKVAAIEEMLRLARPGGLVITTFLLAGRMDEYRQRSDATAFNALDLDSAGNLFRFACTEASPFPHDALAAPGEQEEDAEGIPVGLALAGICLQRQR